MNEPQTIATLLHGLTAARAERAPSAYRLLKKKDGEVVLQAAIPWTQGQTGGVEWKTIPTVVEGEE